ncbi:MAG: hypothetical protein QM751_03405 [Paludibacteraceae bacterium]
MKKTFTILLLVYVSFSAFAQETGAPARLRHDSIVTLKTNEALPNTQIDTLVTDTIKNIKFKPDP